MYWKVLCDTYGFFFFGYFPGGKGVREFRSHLQKKEEILQLPGGGLSLKILRFTIDLICLTLHRTCVNNCVFRSRSGHQSGEQWLLATGKQRAQREQSSFNGFPAVGQIWKQAESHHQENTGKRQTSRIKVDKFISHFGLSIFIEFSTHAPLHYLSSIELKLKSSVITPIPSLPQVWRVCSVHGSAVCGFNWP